MKFLHRLFPTHIRQMKQWEHTRSLGVKAYLLRNFRGGHLLYLLFVSVLPAIVLSSKHDFTLTQFALLVFGASIFWSLIATMFGLVNWHLNEREFRDYEKIKKP